MNAHSTPRNQPLLGSLRAAGRALLRLPTPVAWALVVAWLALNWWSSSKPGSVIWQPWYASIFFNLAHAPLYGLHAMWLTLLVERRDGWPVLTPSRIAALLATVLAFGIVDELHQHFVPHRSMSACDLVTDVIAAACVLTTVRRVARTDASDASIALGLALGVLACAAAAFNATFLPSAFPALVWL